MVCAVCDQEIPPEATCHNGWCNRSDRGFSVVWSVGTYDGALRRAVVAYKYGGQRGWAAVFAHQLAAYLRRNEERFEELGLLVPMPAYRGPGARRDWDPVGLVFSELVAQMGHGWDTTDTALAKRAETASMALNAQQERMSSMQRHLRESLYVSDPATVEGSRVLLIDDVFTEGSSLSAAARVLRDAGAQEVCGLVLARAQLAQAGLRSVG